MERNLICILCPRGCSLKVTMNENDAEVSGNACPKGREYGVSECLNPVRTVTSFVNVSNREQTTVSVKTKAPVKKADIFKVMEKIRAAEVEAPVRIGDVILTDVCGTDIIATKNIE